jgi:putative tRNA adenosine deaminase-associated protein
MALPPGFGAGCGAEFDGGARERAPHLRPCPGRRRAGGVDMTDVDATDFAVVVYREDEGWEAEILPVALTEDLAGMIHALRQQPSLGGTVGLVSVGDDFFVAIRLLGDEVMVFLSDVTASVDWPLAGQVLEYLDIPIPDDEELDQVLPVGDMSIFADLGLDEMDLGAISGDLELYPDEMLLSIAGRIGFAPAFERALDAVP